MAKDWSQYEVAQQAQQPRDWSQYEVGNGDTAGDNSSYGPSFGQKLSGLGEGFRTGVERVTHGILGPVAETGILGQNVKQGFNPFVRAREQALNESMESAPTQTKAGKFIGDIGVRLPGIAAFAPAAGSSLLAHALGAAKAGLTHGLAKAPLDGEYRSLNAVEEAFGDAAGTFIGGGIGKIPSALKDLFKYGKDTAKGLSPMKNLTRILASEEAGKAPAKAVYKEIGSKLGDAGKSSGLKTPNINWENIGKAVVNEDMHPIKELLKEGTYESFNQAQSKLAAIGRDLLKKSKAGADNTVARDAIKRAEKQIHGKLFERFKDVGAEVPGMYQEANELFAKAVKPFELDALKNLKSVMKETGSFDSKLASETLDKLLKDPNFRLGLGKEFPEISRGKIGREFLGKAAKGGGALLGLKGAYDIFKGK